MVKITFVDGTNLVINRNTVLNGFKNDTGDVFYLENYFKDSVDGQFSKHGSMLATVNPMVGIAGFILSVDCFSVGQDTENNVIYFSSAVKSVENL